jgi:hypothetical protein
MDTISSWIRGCMACMVMMVGCGGSQPAPEAVGGLQQALVGAADEAEKYPYVCTILQDMVNVPGAPWSRPSGETTVIAAGTATLISSKALLTAAHVGVYYYPFWPVVGLAVTCDPAPGALPEPALYGPGGPRRLTGTMVRSADWDLAVFLLDQPVASPSKQARLPSPGFVDALVAEGGFKLVGVAYGATGSDFMTLGVRRFATVEYAEPQELLGGEYLGTPWRGANGDSGSLVFLASSRKLLGMYAGRPQGITLYRRLDHPEILDWIRATAGLD